MPSPFPGMDPFLEDPAGWPDVRIRLITSLSFVLSPRVTPEFVVRVEERVYLTDVEDAGSGQLAPDLVVAKSAQSRRAAASVVTIAPPVYVEEPDAEEVRDRYLVIRDNRNQRVVAAIEVLSPTNKIRASRGHQVMIEKRDPILAADASWIEIDLLRAGERSASWRDQCDYGVTLRRPERTGVFVWPIQLADPLPTVAVPLGEGRDAPLEIQRAFDDLYERAQYAITVDYDGALPPPPLAPERQQWVRERITEWQGR